MYSKRHILIALFLVAAAGYVAGGKSPAHEAETLAAGMPAADPTPCPSTWYTVPSPNGTHSDEYLLDVYSLNENTAWAVGRHANIQRWDGIGWSRVPGPDLGGDYDLNGVEAFLPNDVWAVGGNVDSVVLHWDGTAWSSVTVPNIGTLSDLTVTGPNDVWVARGSVLMHLDGTSWTTYTRPAGEEITSMEGSYSDDIWAVGPTVALHWDGTAWTSFPVPYPPGAVQRTLADVATTPDGGAWAVGEWINYNLDSREGGAFRHSFVVRWDGAQWNNVDTGQATSAGLTGVDARSSGDVWAVGNTGLEFGYNYMQRVMHWNGSLWTDFSMPPYNVLTSVALAGPPDNVWAVGGLIDPSNMESDTLVRRYANPCVYPPPPTSTPAPTSAPTSTPVAVLTPTPEPPRCPGERFTDVCPGDYFYRPVLDLNDLGIVSGYNSTPPCDSQAHVPCFKPYNSTTRGQVAKIVGLAAGFNEPVATQTFEDVPPGHTFYRYVERMALRGFIVGYPCGGPGEPCGPGSLPYMRPSVTVNRAQLSKIASLAFGFQDPVSEQTFEDVVPQNHFYPYIENLAKRSIINGYPCGGPGEPCIPPGNKPYFRYGIAVTRGQVAKIVMLAKTQSTPAFTHTPAPDHTSTPTSTPAATPSFMPAIPTGTSSQTAVCNFQA